jgi:hypothetical protein
VHKRHGTIIIIFISSSTIVFIKEEVYHLRGEKGDESEAIRLYKGRSNVVEYARRFIQRCRLQVICSTCMIHGIRSAMLDDSEEEEEERSLVSADIKSFLDHFRVNMTS